MPSLPNQSSNSSPNPNRRWIVIGALFAALAVAAGAFGAHTMEGFLENAESGPRRLAAWKTAAQYQFFNALGLIALGLMQTTKTKSQFASGVSMAIGILVFSGVLYAYSLTYVKVLGAIVPIGGVSMLLAWSLFAISATGSVTSLAMTSPAIAVHDEAAS